MIKGSFVQWIAVLTNVAVLLSVFLLFIELRQSVELTRVQMIQDRINTNQQLESEFFDPYMSSIWVKSFKSPASMSLEEIRSMDAYMVAFMNQVMREYDLEQAGLLEAGATVKLMQENFWFLFGSPFAKAWWDELGQSGLSTEFFEMANPEVEAIRDNELEERFSRLQRAIGASN